MIAFLAGLWDSFATFICWLGLPVVFGYHVFCGNSFMNMAQEDAVGLEKAGNVLLVPFQYVFNGKVIKKNPNHPNEYIVEAHFNYTENFGLKMGAAAVTSPFSLVLGSVVKGCAFLFSDVRKRHDAFVAWRTSPELHSNMDQYRAFGMAVDEIQEQIPQQYHQRRPGDEAHMQGEKEALKDIAQVLKKNKIVFWVDCGTCLGTYRYGGSIPWDGDIDIAILQNDFENAKYALSQLDPTRYAVQDWSGRDRPKSYLKVYDRKSNILVDVYIFKIDPKDKNVCLILSNENSMFLSNAWKIRERRYVLPTPFDVVFPLRKATFDGVEVYVPNQTQKYLQMRYGQNLNPVKVYDPKTGQYEKDLTHPYWQLPHVK